MSRVGNLLLGCAALAMWPAYAIEVTVDNVFNPGLGIIAGIAVDHTSGNVYVYGAFDDDITEYAPDGTFVGNIARPGNSSNDFDLDVARSAINVGGMTVPGGSLLVVNGDDSPEALYAVDPTDSSLLGSVTLPTASTVGGSHVTGLDLLVAIDFQGNDDLYLVDPADGSEVMRFEPELPFSVFWGDVDHHSTRNTLMVVSSDQPIIREVTIEGFCERDIDLSLAGFTDQMAGIAIDEEREDIWLSSLSGSVYRVTVSSTAVDGDGDGVFDEDDNCLTVMNADQRDADGDGVGTACDADFNNDCTVDFSDLAELKAAFFSSDPEKDLDGDGNVNFVDLSIMKEQFFAVPGPTGQGGPCGCGL